MSIRASIERHPCTISIRGHLACKFNLFFGLMSFFWLNALSGSTSQISSVDAQPNSSMSEALPPSWYPSSRDPHQEGHSYKQTRLHQKAQAFSRQSSSPRLLTTLTALQTPCRFLGIQPQRRYAGTACKVRPRQRCAADGQD